MPKPGLLPMDAEWRQRESGGTDLSPPDFPNAPPHLPMRQTGRGNTKEA